MDPTPKRIGLIVLAAGASRRMGQPKQLIELEGVSLIEKCVDAALASPIWPVVVVLGAQAGQIRPRLSRRPLLLVENPRWAEGMGTSLSLGVKTLRQFSRTIQGAVIAVCDQPRFDAGAIGALLERQRQTGAEAVAARYEGRLGVPALFMGPRLDALEALAGDQGARALLQADPTVQAVDLPQLAFDLDTPEDLMELNGR